MDNVQNGYLPDYILDAINLRVISKLGNFYQDLTPKRNANVIKACKRIEENVMNVYSIIVEYKTALSHNKGYGTCYYHFFTSVFILLYYRHRNEEQFNMIVFPQLRQHMGEFASRLALTSEIDKMLAEEAKLRMLRGQASTEKTLKPSNATSDTATQKELENLKKENLQLRKTLQEYTDSEECNNKKTFFTTKQIAIAAYFILDDKDIHISDNQLKWANFLSKLTRRNVQNIRKELGRLNADMDELKDDAIVVAEALDAVAPQIANKVRKNFNIVVTTHE